MLSFLSLFWPLAHFRCYRCDFCDLEMAGGQKSGHDAHFIFIFGHTKNVEISTKSRGGGQMAIILYILID